MKGYREICHFVIVKGLSLKYFEHTYLMTVQVYFIERSMKMPRRLPVLAIYAQDSRS